MARHHGVPVPPRPTQDAPRLISSFADSGSGSVSVSRWVRRARQVPGKALMARWTDPRLASSGRPSLGWAIVCDGVGEIGMCAITFAFQDGVLS